MEFKSPVGKRGWKQRNSSLPILGDFDDIEGNSFSGYFNGCSVVVSDPSQIQVLYSHGFFGKGSLSRSFPNFEKCKRNARPILSEQRWKRRKEWETEMESFLKQNFETSDKDDVVVIESDEDSKKSADIIDVESPKSKSHDDITIIDDSKDVDTNEFMSNEVVVIQENEDPSKIEAFQPRLEKKMPVVFEELHLLLEEAFFLHFALGCLNVTDMSGESLDAFALWSLFRSTQDDFIESYIAYHYFRAKGWVVKSGLKFGGRFLLYKDGPPYYHASYIVRIECINHGNQKVLWDEILALHRMAEASNKEVLTCQIEWPDDISDIDDPNIIRRYKVSEALLRRWHACKENNDVDDS